MRTEENSKNESNIFFQNQINKLTNRVTAIEKAIDIEKVIKFDSENDGYQPDIPGMTNANKNKGDNWLESKLGEVGLGLLGNVVLLFFVIFLMTYTQNLGYRILPSIIGFTSVISVLLFSYYNKKSYNVLTKMLSISSILLAYYVILKFHFFVDNPLIQSPLFTIILLFVPISFLIYYGIKNKLEFAIGIAIFLMVISSLIYDTYQPSLIILVIAALMTLLIFIKYSWWRFLIFSIFFIYIAHAFWMWNNPFMGGSSELLPTHHFNMIYLFIYGSIFASTLLIRNKEQIKDTVFIAITLINALCFSLVLISNILAYFEDNYMLTFILISLYCLVFSIIIKSRKTKLFAPAFYACFGYMALSVAVYGYFGFPDTYLLLTIQSLLVVSMALWFRSRIIVITNTFLFMGILIAYLFIEESHSPINFTFAIVALISGRLLNWKKERLTLQTEFLRNFYLFSALGMILFALYGSIPAKYISISWIAAAGLFFLLSVLLNNVKYRWLGFIAILSTIIYLLLVDLARMDTKYRIFVFLFLAILSISISVYYTKRMKNKT